MKSAVASDANKFIGDGSLLAGVGSDRIVSEATNVIATQDGFKYPL
jgi:hypothetical protein